MICDSAEPASTDDDGFEISNTFLSCALWKRCQDDNEPVSGIKGNLASRVMARKQMSGLKIGRPLVFMLATLGRKQSETESKTSRRNR